MIGLIETSLTNFVITLFVGDFTLQRYKEFSNKTILLHEFVGNFLAL